MSKKCSILLDGYTEKKELVINLKNILLLIVITVEKKKQYY